MTSENGNINFVEDGTRKFVLLNNHLEEITKVLDTEMKYGLSRSQNVLSCLSMIPTFVRDVPNGEESGKFIAINLNETHFRISEVVLSKNIDIIYAEDFELPAKYWHESARPLFNHIADGFCQFLVKRKLNSENVPIGFTFAQPLRHESLYSARLIRACKEFQCKGMLGQDIALMLREAVARRDFDIGQIAVVNDTTSIMMECAMKNPQCGIGLVADNGVNMCYIEKLDLVHTWKCQIDDPRQVIINIEMGGFGDDNCIDFIRTRYDDQLEQSTVSPGVYLFEKMAGGRYIGELVRLVIVNSIDNGWMLRGKINNKLTTPDILKAEQIARIATDSMANEEAKKLFLEMDECQASEDDCECLKIICTRVYTRSIDLIATALAAIVNRMHRKYNAIGIAGCLFDLPKYKEFLEKKTRSLIHPDYEFEFVHEDVRGIGSAIAAAVALRKRSYRRNSR